MNASAQMASSLLPGLYRPPAQSSLPFPFLARRMPCSVSSQRSTYSASASSSVSSSSSSSWEREEQRWLREEQRWLREEQRWLREESRWDAERQSLLREIASLRLQIEVLERDRPSLEAVLVAAGGSEERDGTAPPRPSLMEKAQVKEMILEEVSVSEVAVEKRQEVVVEEKKTERLGRKTLRKGSEGEDVRAMQVQSMIVIYDGMLIAKVFEFLLNRRQLMQYMRKEALQMLGFYSGEEDMEYSSFSSSTERAVKTWQASLGTPEDGIMTVELLERLFMAQRTRNAASENVSNGSIVTSITETTEVQQKVVRENGDAEYNVSTQRVFLLGENRWEEPSRLIGRDKPLDRSKPASLIKCLSCRGEGRLMCTECDGSGEPNVEPQFLEWVDEGARCPYCEGLGYTVCDVCEGRTTVET